MLQVEQLCCLRENITLFSNLTFSLNPGSWLQVRGTNGSGKSSLLRSIVGLLSCVSGQIRWKGRNIRFPDRDYARDYAYLGHKIAVQKRLTPFENLKWWNKFNAASCQDNASLHRALALWKLTHISHIPCEQLSAGQCQRVALVRLSLQRSLLWVLDEPTTALDVEGRQLFELKLQQHLQSGGMAIIVSHTPLEGISFSAQCLVMEERKC